jgi:hypothetical protein
MSNHTMNLTPSPFKMIREGKTGSVRGCWNKNIADIDLSGQMSG